MLKVGERWRDGEGEEEGESERKGRRNEGREKHHAQWSQLRTSLN